MLHCSIWNLYVSLKRSRWRAGRFRKLRSRDIDPTFRAAVEGMQDMQDYNNKIIEFTHANTNAAFDFVQRMSGVKSPSEFLELWTEHARKQVETLTERASNLRRSPRR